MAYTPDQIRQKAYELENKGAPSSAIEEFVKRATQEAGIQPKVAAPEKGFVRKVAEDIVRPIAEVGVSGYNLAKQTAATATAVVKGEKTVEDEMVPRKLPFLGTTKPAITGSEDVKTTAKKVAGYGAEIASTVAGGTGGVQVVKSGFRGLITQGAKQGAKAGIVAGVEAGAGRSLEEDKPAGEILTEGLIGGGFGLITGGVAGGAAGALGAVTRKSGKMAKEAAQGSIETIKSTAPVQKTRKFLSGLDDQEFTTIRNSLEAKISGINKNIQKGVLNREKGQELIGKAITERVERAKALGERFDSYIEYAKKSSEDFNIPSALGKAGEEAEKTLETINLVRKKVGQQKGAMLEKIAAKPIVGINTTKEKFSKLISERLGARIMDDINDIAVAVIDKKDSTFAALPGRISRTSVDPAEGNILKKAKSVLDQLEDTDSLQKVDDAVDSLQALLDSERALQAVPRTTKAEGVVKSVIGELQAKVNKIAGARYKNLNRQYAQVIRVYDALNKRLQFDPKLGTSRGDALLKQIFSPAGNTTRGLFKKVEELTGVNLVDEAVLARLAMKMVGDTRADSLLENTAQQVMGGSSIKQGLLKALVKKITKKIADPEEVGKELLEKEGIPVKRPKLPFKNGAVRQTANIDLQRAKGLSAEDRKIEDAAFAKYSANPEKLVDEYIASNGKIVNTDEARKLYIDVGYTGSNSAAVQEPASVISKAAWRKNLETNPETYATLLSGGSGAGKTSAIKRVSELSTLTKESAAILDGNLSSYGSAVKRITEAIEAGKTPRLIYVYRDPVDAFVEGVVKRMKDNQGEMGRIVPIKVLAENHVDSWKVIQKLYDESPIKEMFYFIDNSLGKNKAKRASLAVLKEKIKYPDNLEAVLKNKAKELYDAGTITAEQYQRYIE